MRFLLASLFGAATVAAFTVPNLDAAYARRRSSSCPAVWKTVADDLKAIFAGCTDAARAAIRTSFHDCFPTGGCDGSLILANECTTRAENTQMVTICSTLADEIALRNVSTADTIQLAAALGITACGGPAITFKVGRKDSSTASPTGQMPAGNAAADTQVTAFQDKGFTISELVALVGAHSAGKNLDGDALDSTVDTLDATVFYPETQDGAAGAVDALVSDQNLAASSVTSATWKGFGRSQGSWTGAFVPAMEKMATMGNDVASLVDCSQLIS